MGAELYHADGRADMATLTVALRNFANAPKNYKVHYCKSISTKQEKLHFCI
jgi:hypothetical protein